MDASMDVARASVVDGLNNISSLKEGQTIALKAFIEKEDVFAVLLTGFGKSLIYQLAPLVGKLHNTYVLRSRLLCSDWFSRDQPRTNRGQEPLFEPAPREIAPIHSSPRLIYGTVVSY